jgi:hypothetical protein
MNGNILCIQRDRYHNWSFMFRDEIDLDDDWTIPICDTARCWPDEVRRSVFAENGLEDELYQIAAMFVTWKPWGDWDDHCRYSHATWHQYGRRYTVIAWPIAIGKLIERTRAIVLGHSLRRDAARMVREAERDLRDNRRMLDELRGRLRKGGYHGEEDRDHRRASAVHR